MSIHSQRDLMCMDSLVLICRLVLTTAYYEMDVTNRGGMVMVWGGGGGWDGEGSESVVEGERARGREGCICIYSCQLRYKYYIRALLITRALLKNNCL